MRDAYEEPGKEWPELDAMKHHIEQLPVPAGIDTAIRNGILLGRRRRKSRMLTRIVSYAACVLLLACAASVRYSPAVAAYVGDIPGLRSLVQLIHYDKGLQLALENDFMQPVGLSDEHDGIRLTVDGILADESRIVLFYTLNNTDGRKRVVNLRDVKLVNSRNTSISYGSSDFNEEWVSKMGTIDFTLHGDSGMPAHLELELKVGPAAGDKPNDGPVWRYEIPVDKSKFEGRKDTYDIKKTVAVEGQRITFGTMTVYPTRIGLEVAYDPGNAKKLFYFDDLRIEDETGETFGSIMNGVSATNIDENRQILYFQSNYFRRPKQLYLRAGSIRALDKSKLEVQVDLDHGKLLSRPDDRLELSHVGTGAKDGQDMLVFRLRKDDPRDKNYQYQLFAGTYTDASGQSFESNQSGSTPGEFQYYIRRTDYRSPLTLTISDYPARIRGDINLRIK